MQVLHQSKYYSLLQCDLKRCFLFKTATKSIHLTFCQLLTFRKKVRAIDLETHFDSDQYGSGLEILFLKNMEHIFLLDTYQVIDLKEFMESAFFLLENRALLEPLS